MNTEKKKQQPLTPDMNATRERLLHLPRKSGAKQE